MKVKTGEIIKELKEKGVKYNQYHARIKWVVNYLGIKPTKTNQGNFYTKAEAKQIVRYICDGYRKWGANHKTNKRTKTKSISIKPSYSTRKIELLEENIKDLELSIKNYRGAIEELKDRISFLEDQNIILRQENELLKQPKKEEKRRKFWFFK